MTRVLNFISCFRADRCVQAGGGVRSNSNLMSLVSFRFLSRSELTSFHPCRISVRCNQLALVNEHSASGCTPLPQRLLHLSPARLFTTSSALSFISTSTNFIKKRMPPKKTVVEKKALLGRPSNNLKIGIVGMPNVGKSSLFNVIAKCGRCAMFPIHRPSGL